MNWEEAKDEVAKKYGFKSWNLKPGGNCMETHITSESLISERYSEAAELYARAKHDEACEAQITLLIKQMPVAQLVRREISTMQFAENLKNSPKPEFKP